MQFSEVNNGTGREINEGELNVFPLKVTKQLDISKKVT
jgi:hypothetical protein